MTIYTGGNEEYLFDIIVDRPEDVCELMEDTLNWDFTNAEREFFELATTKCPHTEVRINPDDFRKLFEPYCSEVIFTDIPLMEYTERFYESLDNYNKSLASGFKIDAFCPYNQRGPWTQFYDGGKELYPDIYPANYYVSEVKTRLQGLRQKYKNGKLSDEMYESAERLRSKIKGMEDDFRLMLIEYGKKLYPFFEEWQEYKIRREEFEKTYKEFREVYHYRGTMDFGRFKGKSIGYVIRHDLQYIEWALKNKTGFMLKGDDLEEFIEKAGYDPTPKFNSETLPSDETIADLSCFLRGTGCELDSVVFKTSKVPETKALMDISGKYPGLKYSITQNGDYFNVSFSGCFKSIETEGYITPSNIIPTGNPDEEDCPI